MGMWGISARVDVWVITVMKDDWKGYVLVQLNNLPYSSGILQFSSSFLLNSKNNYILAANTHLIIELTNKLQ